MPKQPDVLKAFPKSPGSSVWVCQNLTRGTEYTCDLEQMTCSCPSFEHRRACKHLDYALDRAKLYGGDRKTYEEFVERWRRMDEASQKAVFV